MEKDLLLRNIAEKGYDVLFGAKTNFATYDILTCFPKFTSAISIIVGILGLLITCFTSKFISVIILILGIFGLYIDGKSGNAKMYDDQGKSELDIYNKIKLLYCQVKSSKDEDLSDYSAELESLSSKFYNESISDQIFLFSDIYAHYKIFGQFQYGWMDEQLHFRFWKDKVPSCLKSLLLMVLLFTTFTFLYCNWNQLCLFIHEAFMKLSNMSC